MATRPLLADDPANDDQDAMEPVIVGEEADGAVIIEFRPRGEGLASLQQQPVEHGANLLTLMSADEAGRLYSDLLAKIEDDIASREPWETTATKAMDLLGLKIMDGAASVPFEGASNATETLLLEAWLTWQAGALAETLPLAGPAQAVLIADPPPQAKQPAEAARTRAERFVNHLLTKIKKGYASHHDRMLFDVGLMGAGFKKFCADPSETFGIRIERIPAGDLIVSYHADDQHTGRVTHRTRLTDHEMRGMVDGGIYVEAAKSDAGRSVEALSSVESKRDELAGQAASSVALDTEFEIFECHDDAELGVDPGQGPRPYIIVLDKTAGALRAVYRNWKEGDEQTARRAYFSAYSLIPAKSAIYGYGLGHLLGNTTSASQESLRSIINSATLATMPGGFKDSTLDLGGKSDTPFRPGEWRDAENQTGNLANSLVPLPYRGPDPSLIEMRSQLVEAGRRVAGQSGINIAEAINQNAPVGSVLAALDEAARIPSSIHRRLWQSMADELEIIRGVLVEALPQGQQIEYAPGRFVLAEDLAIVTLEPAMRPGAPSRAHRIAEAQAKMQLAQQFPQLHDMRAVVVEAYNAMGIEAPEQFLIKQEEARPADPVTEAQAALAGRPLAVGIAQDHDAHIAGHGSAMQMFMLNPSLGEAAQSAAGLLQAHIAEHFAKKMLVGVAMRLGIDPMQFEQGIPPELEAQAAPAIAEAMAEMLAEMPKPQDPANAQIEVARIREQGAMDREKLKAAVNTAEEKAETGRNNADNSTALAIAALRQARPTTRPSAPTNNRNPNPGGFR